MHPANHDVVPITSVAIIGAGPAGLVAARWLKQYGFNPVIFEASSRLGGQWNGQSPTSGTWSGMRTNTSRVMTAFSDADHEGDTAIYPQRDEMFGYLERYAEKFELCDAIRFNARIESIERSHGLGWLIRWISGSERSESVFRRVIVATGRQISPAIPRLPGIESFSGALGVVHTGQYDGPDRYRGKRVVVVGCSVSALEIASELALSGAGRVTSSYQRQRYVLPKISAGIPTDHVMFTRAAALAGAVMPPEMLAEGLKSEVLRLAGSPEQFGARKPHDNIFAAGISQSQHFLPSVAEKRIETRSWIEKIAGRVIQFEDGTRCEADALLLGTGYRLHLPFLAPDIAAALGLDDQHIELHEHTFHPDLPGLAFIGLYDQVGPLFPVLELQARWIAYAWAGVVAEPSPSIMDAGLTACRTRRGLPQSVPMHVMALLFARNAAAEPDLSRFPELERALLFGPLSPASFRLSGPDSLPDAPERTASAAAAFGAIRSSAFTPQEEQLRAMLFAQAKAA